MRLKKILIIEDDADAASVLEAYLKRENFEVAIVGDGLKSLDVVAHWKPNLILLDVMLPGLHGTEVLAAIRRKSDIPVIMVTAMGEAHDRIGALRYGADDYVVKPYNPGEVVARVHAVLRRGTVTTLSPDLLCWKELEVDTESLTVAVNPENGDRKLLELTPTELCLLITLMRTPTLPYSRLQLLERCLPESEALERVVDTHIYNLRKKLEQVGISDVLLNVRSVGYRFRQP